MRTGAMRRRGTARLAGVVGLWAGLSLLRVMAAEAPPGGAGLAASVGAGAGRPQTAAEIIPARPRAEENGAPLFLEAIAALEAENVWDTTLASLAAEAYAAAFSTAAQANLLGLVEALHLPAEGNRSPTVDEVCDEFARQLEGPAACRALALCAQAVTRPACWFDLDYGQGPNLQMPHLAKLRSLARFLAAASQALAEGGATTRAWECIELQLQLGERLRDEPLLIAQLVRTAILRMGLATLQSVAALALPDPAQAARLDALLDHLDDTAPWALAFDGERLLLGDWVYAQPPEKIGELLKGFAEVTDAPVLTAAQLATEHAAGSAALIRLADLASQPYYRVKEEIALRFNPARFADTVVVKVLVPALAPACSKMAACQAEVRVARLGLRLTLHRAEHDSYPPALDLLQWTGLTPEKQQDPFTGAALCYRLEGRGFVLYSVGADGSDDGGRARTGNAKQGFDIAWRVTR